MQSLAIVLHRVGTLLFLGVFALSFVSAMFAGVDPLAAMVRSVAGTAVIALLFVVLCRTTLSVFGAGQAAAPDAMPNDESNA